MIKDMDTKLVKVAIYTRVSPKHKGKKEDTENQDRELAEFISKQNGWVIFDIYTDVRVSGAKKGSDRIQFTRMMEDASKRRFDLLLFWALDRLSREGVYETLQYLKQLTSYGVEYRSYTEPYFDSCGIFKDAVIAIMATLAKQERLKLIERTIAGLETARLKGKTLGRPRAPVDYDKMVKMRSTGATMKAIAKHFKVSEATICRMLQAQTLPS